MFCLHANETLLAARADAQTRHRRAQRPLRRRRLRNRDGGDLRIARKDAGKIGLPEVALGVLPGTGGTQRLARLVGKSRAIELMVTGKTVSYEQALDWGVVNDMYEGTAEEFRAQIADYAKQFCTPNKAPMAVGHIKRSVQTGAELPLQDASRSSASCNRCSSRAKTPKKASPPTTKSASPSSRTNSGRPYGMSTR